VSLRAIEMIDRAIAIGIISEDEHDQIIKLVHKDGKIDAQESEKLSELFTGIQSTKIKLIKEKKAYSENLKQLKEEALQRDFKIEPQKITNFENSEPSPRKIEQEPTTSKKVEEEIYSDLESCLDIPIYKETTLDFNKETKLIKASERLLEANLNGTLWIKSGSMVANRGFVNFTREGIAEHGLGKLIKRGLTGESTPLTKAEGEGKVYLADQGKKITIANLKGSPLYVQAEHILAFTSSVKWEIQPLFNVGTALAGGLFHIRFHGSGELAFTSRFDPFVLRVTPDKPLMTDARATVAWSSGVIPSLKTDINFQTLIGRTSGESVQLRFEGDGIVVIQPYEELKEEKFEKKSH